MTKNAHTWHCDSSHQCGNDDVGNLQQLDLTSNMLDCIFPTSALSQFSSLERILLSGNPDLQVRVLAYSTLHLAVIFSQFHGQEDSQSCMKNEMKDGVMVTCIAGLV